jgi:bla regulator protein BlaR1
MKPRYTKSGIDYRIVDHPDMTFVDDPELTGTWISVGFVRETGAFTPGSPSGLLHWKTAVFQPGGKTALTFTDSTSQGEWTKGINKRGDKAEKYQIKTLSGTPYLFVEWKSGDYSVRGDKPSYYVFEKSN